MMCPLVRFGLHLRCVRLGLLTVCFLLAGHPGHTRLAWNRAEVEVKVTIINPASPLVTAPLQVSLMTSPGLVVPVAAMSVGYSILHPGGAAHSGCWLRRPGRRLAAWPAHPLCPYPSCGRVVLTAEMPTFQTLGARRILPCWPTCGTAGWPLMLAGTPHCQCDVRPASRGCSQGACRLVNAGTIASRMWRGWFVDALPALPVVACTLDP